MTKLSIKELKETLVSEKIVIIVIIINSLILFLGAFPSYKYEFGHPFYYIDYICTVYFVIELILKVNLRGWKNYWASGWNKFDFIIILASTPLLISPFINTAEFGIILILRIGRLFRFFKLAKFIPNQEKLWRGIKRAMAASFGFVITLIIYNFILAIGASYLFSDIDPQHFGNPIISIYTMFKVFTIEGWYEIPDFIAENSTPFMGFCVRGFFVFTVLTGGIIGLSIANAVFVDEMVMDNTDTIESKIDALKKEIKQELENIKTSNTTELQVLYDRINESIKNIQKE